MRLHEIAHQIDHIVGMDLDVPKEQIPFLLDYICAGYGVEGDRIERPMGLEVSMRCIDCPDKTTDCAKNCPVWQAFASSE